MISFITLFLITDMILIYISQLLWYRYDMIIHIIPIIDISWYYRSPLVALHFFTILTLPLERCGNPELSDNITIYRLSESYGLSYHISITTVVVCISVSYRLSEKSNGIYHIILIITIDLNSFIISYWLSDAYGTQFDIRYLQKLHMDCHLKL